MINFILKIRRIIKDKIAIRRNENLIRSYIKGGRIPWSNGYHQYKIEQIKKEITKAPWPELTGIHEYGVGVDERIVEYPWIFSHLSNKNTRLLDAGSTLNHDYVLSHDLLKQKHITVCTYHPEIPSFPERRINYVYEDLRQLPFQAEWFDEIVSISTLEHIDMDNSLYGYELSNIAHLKQKSFEYLKVINEMNRVLKVNGKLLMTVPFGKYEPHGFFQQFDYEMVERICDLLKKNGKCFITFFKYRKSGWEFSDLEHCQFEESFNPHTGIGKKDDGAAHSRAICCIEFLKDS